MTNGFDVATQNVEPQGGDVSTAILAHSSVRDVLADDELLGEWGIESVLIGSYKRRVSIRRIKDVDVFCRLPGLPGDVTGTAALSEFKRVLSDQFTVTSQDRSLNVEHTDWGDMHVDIVPARPADSYWQIPDKSNPGAGWQGTNPEQMTALSSAMNDQMGDLYVPTVKLLRQTRRSLQVKRPGGFFVEMALYAACDRGLVEGSNLEEFYVSALGGLAQITRELVELGIEIPDPSRPGETLTFRATDIQWRTARDAFAQAATDADRALNAARCEAASIYHRLMGKNSDGQVVYPLPDDCNDDGTTKSRLTSGDRSVRGGDQKFA